MNSTRKLFRRINDVVCGDEGVLFGTCKTSLNGNKNYILLVVGSIIIQYSLPLIFLLLIAPFLVGNLALVWTIEFLRALNPFFVILYLPITLVNASILGVLLIGTLSVTISYWYFFYREIGAFMLAALGAWLFAMFAWYIPVIGPPISIMISAVPWLPVGAIMHYWTYRYS